MKSHLVLIVLSFNAQLNREVSDELESEIQAGRMELKMTRSACERLEGVLVSLRQGAIGLFQRLEHARYLLDSDDENIHQTNESASTIDPVEALCLSELVLSKMLEVVGGGDSSPSRTVAAIPGGGDNEGTEDEDAAQAAPDDVSSTWAALANDEVPNARLNVRVKTLKDSQDSYLPEYSVVGGTSVGGGKSEILMPKEGASSLGEDDGHAQTSEIVPTRDFLKLSSSRQHAEVMRKKDADMKRKKMQERYDAADENEKQKMGSLADKKKRQREAINHLCQKKELMGVPPGVTPKQDAMTKSQVFLSHSPELL